jgi:hypothetical protein
MDLFDGIKNKYFIINNDIYGQNNINPKSTILYLVNDNTKHVKINISVFLLYLVFTSILRLIPYFKYLICCVSTTMPFGLKYLVYCYHMQPNDYNIVAQYQVVGYRYHCTLPTFFSYLEYNKKIYMIDFSNIPLNMVFDDQGELIKYSTTCEDRNELYRIYKYLLAYVPNMPKTKFNRKAIRYN